MKYQAPFGSIDPNEPYVDRNTPGAVRGSVPPAAAIEDPQREMDHLISATGYTPSEADLYQVAKAIRSLRLNYVNAGGSADALTGNLSIAPASYVELINTLIVVWTGASQNTGSATLNLNEKGALPIHRMDGSATQKGDLPANSYVFLVCTGTSFRNLLAGGPNARASGQEVWNEAGTYSWTPPPGVYRIFGESWGAGGGGGGANSGTIPSAGGGGGSGEYTPAYIPVTPGVAITIVVGEGGAAGISGVVDGGDGGASSIAGICIALGGEGGTSAQDAWGDGGAGGASAAVGSLAGGAGGAPTDNPSAPIGGVGGGAYNFPGWGTGNQGTSGTTGPMPATGGNGGASATGTGIKIGGAGRDGYVRITF